MPALAPSPLRHVAPSALSQLARARRWAPAMGALVWLTWAVSLVGCFRFEAAAHSPVATAGLFLWMTWLFCGLFITSHDACHQSAWPGRPRLNAAMGWLCALSYAGFSFANLRRQHGLHHAHGGTANDPDYCAIDAADGDYAPFWPWAFRFFRHYVTWQQILTMTAISQVLLRAASVPAFNVYAFWALPSLLSALQLFLFGTYLPHRPVRGVPFADHHRARAQVWPLWLSLVSCYFFGYHHVHHLEPRIPWYCLPAGHRLTALRQQARPN